MIDFVKVITKQPNSILNNNYLDFKGTFKQNGGEISNKYETIYKGLKFEYYENSEVLLIKGSLHKYFNNGLHNYNDFDYNALNTVLTDISLKFNLCLDSCYLQNIEFGLNIEPPIKTNDLLINLLLHRSEILKNISITNGFFKQAVYSQFIIKAYNKAMQYKLTDEIFRFEIKIIKMQKIKHLNIRTLDDLKNKNLLMAFYKVLLNEWLNVTQFEQPNKKSSIKAIIKDKKFYQWQNPNYWQSLSKQAKNRQKKNFKKYVLNHTPNHYNKIVNLLNDKINDLLK
jgi:hypothetical protein